MPDPELDAKLAQALERLDRLVGSAESDPDPAFRERIFELLEAIDAVHRPLVWRVGELAYHDHPEFFEERLLGDALASLLFEMYGLVSPERREGPVAATDGPAVFAGAPGGPEARSGSFITLDDLEASIPPPLAWYTAARGEDVAEGALLGRDVEGERLLLARVGGEVRAYRDACPGSPMPLSTGAVREGVLLCPWHDCRFDLESGRRVDREGAPLEAVPLTVRDGEVRVGLRLRRRVA